MGTERGYCFYTGFFVVQIPRPESAGHSTCSDESPHQLPHAGAIKKKSSNS